MSRIMPVLGRDVHLSSQNDSSANLDKLIIVEIQLRGLFNGFDLA
jgi:hypothetical protein